VPGRADHQLRPGEGALGLGGQLGPGGAEADDGETGAETGGADAGTAEAGHGIAGMRERAMLAGGSLQIRSAGGTFQITATLPSVSARRETT